MIVIDGTDYIFGRLASKIAKKALEGEEIHLINAEKIVIKGDPQVLSHKYLERRRYKNKANPENSPKWPKVPHMLVKRMIRGMLPWRTARGKEAYKRILVYTQNPKNLTATDFESEKYDGIARHMTINGLCKKLGYQE